MIYKHKFDIGLQDINSKNQITNKKILSCLENAAVKHGDYVGLGMNDLNKSGLTWMILDWEIEMNRRPSYGDIIEVHTWSKCTNKCYSYRDYEIYVDGEKYGIATSKWLMVDINRGRPARIDEEYIAQYKPEPDKSTFDISDIDKLQEQEEYERECKCVIRRSDIDINGHVHNLNYMDIIEELLSDEERKTDFKDIRITYKKEIKFGDEVKCFCHKSDNKYYFIIKSNEDKNINAIIEMK